MDTFDVDNFYRTTRPHKTDRQIETHGEKIQPRPQEGKEKKNQLNNQTGRLQVIDCYWVFTGVIDVCQVQFY